MDPDCFGEFNNIYCKGVYGGDGNPLGLERSRGVQCALVGGEVSCVLAKDKDDSKELDCPQLPSLTPSQLAKGRGWNTPPLGWMCPPEKYYELNGVNPSAANCDCGPPHFHVCCVCVDAL
jgi:hypothetical protein